MRRGDRSDEPFSWWGPVWETPPSRSLNELVSQGVLTSKVAALLAALVARRASIVVAAEPSGAGKTTVLTALLDYLPSESRRVYLRGCYEPFDFLRTTEPNETTLLVNEISGHLPIYLWGPAVGRVFGAARAGYQLAATAHARSVEGFVQSLTGYPLFVPTAELAAVDLLVLLDAWSDVGEVHRVVQRVVSLSNPAGPDRVEPQLLAARNDRTGQTAIYLDATRCLYARLGGSPTHLTDAMDQAESTILASLHPS